MSLFKRISYPAVFTLLLSSLPCSARADSLCSGGEKVFFSCTTKVGKTLSLCGSKDLGKAQGYLQYRFGVPGKIELEFPSEKTNSQAKFRYSHYFRAQVDLTQVCFTNAGYRYGVFADYNSEEKPAVNIQGVRVGTGEKEQELKCEKRALNQLSGLEGILQAAEDYPCQ